jgi:hypothetical protein
MFSIPEPNLAPPGAGLPPLEHVVARLLFAIRRWTASRDSDKAHFNRERLAIRAIVGACDEQSGARRVLIKRVRGMEDSSRYWSVWMTLDHLRIVHQAIAGVLRSLAIGRVPPGAASTAAVKPSPAVGAAIIHGYEQSCDHLLAAIESVRDWLPEPRYAHPWFGPLCAAGWRTLAAGHLHIHRVQIERIIAGTAATQEATDHANGNPASASPVAGLPSKY